jgi:hypothetical protein
VVLLVQVVHQELQVVRVLKEHKVQLVHKEHKALKVLKEQ